MRDLPQSCPQGMTESDLREVLGTRAAQRPFWRWMTGQTMSLCTGRKYDHEAQEYKPSECFGRPHGAVVYRHDVERFLKGLPVID
jgi:hypothetical protein